MKSVCLYFQVHQPNRLKRYTFFDIGKDHFYEDDELNRAVLDKVSEKCYLPANRLLTHLLKKYNGKFKVAFSLSGVFLEQLEHHRPDVLASFQEMVATGHVELLTETYYHSLAYMYSKKEFKKQVALQDKKIKELFGHKPKVFRNTELIYYNELAACVEEMGYKGILSEGVDWYLNGRTPNVLYKAPNVSNIKTLLKNFKLSDDIAFRFSDTNWTQYPLNPEKFADWVQQSEGELINLFMDYETLGEHQWADTGIFDFWEKLPQIVLDKGLEFITPGEAIDKLDVRDTYDVHDAISWADTERDLSAWVGNTMQQEALGKLYAIEEAIDQSTNKDLVHVWRKLQTSDHFYYMCTKFYDDAAVHEYFSPYDSPYDGYIYYMNALSDLEITLDIEGLDVYK